VPAVAVFVFIGARPASEWLDCVLARDEHGFILTGIKSGCGDGAGMPRGRPSRETVYRRFAAAIAELHGSVL
jgi:hypothetical protein